MKKSVWFVFAVFIGNSVFAEKLGTIPEVLAPQMIKVYEGELFVVEDHQIFIYDLKTMAFKKKLGKSGQGPGEFNLDPSRSIVMSVHPEFIMAESRNKIIFYNRQGDFLKEVKKQPTILQTHPLGENFAVLRIIYSNDGDAHFAVCIVDKNLKEIVELYRQKFFSYKSTVHVMPDSLNCCVIGDHLIVEESPEGFLVKIFDSKGNEIKKIQQSYEKREVTDFYREKALKEFCGIPSMQRIREEQGAAALKELLNETNIVYPEFFPAIQHITTDGEDLYVQTSKALKNQFEFVVFDSSGVKKSELQLPQTAEVPFLVRLQGDKKFFSIYKGNYYYLSWVDAENDDEFWEVHYQKSTYQPAG